MYSFVVDACSVVVEKIRNRDPKSTMPAWSKGSAKIKSFLAIHEVFGSGLSPDLAQNWIAFFIRA